MWKKREELDEVIKTEEINAKVFRHIGPEISKITDREQLETLLKWDLKKLEENIRRLGIPDGTVLTNDEMQYIWYAIHDAALANDMLASSLPTPPLTPPPEIEANATTTEILSQQYETLNEAERMNFREVLFTNGSNPELATRQSFSSLKRLLQSLLILVGRGNGDAVRILPQVQESITKQILGVEYSSLNGNDQVNQELRSLFRNALINLSEEERTNLLESQGAESLLALSDDLRSVISHKDTARLGEEDGPGLLTQKKIDNYTAILEIAEASLDKIIQAEISEREDEDLDEGVFKEIPLDDENVHRSSLPLPGYIEVKKAEIIESNKKLQADIAKLPVSSKNKKLILDHMIALKANLAVLEAKAEAGTITEQEKAVYDKGASLLSKFDSCIRDKEFSGTLKNPKVCNEFVKMLESAAELSKDPQNPNAKAVAQLIETTKKDQKSFTPRQDAAWKALKIAAVIFLKVVVACAILALVAAAIYFTAGAAIPLVSALLAPAASMIGGIGSTIVATGATAAAATATVATTAAATTAATATAAAATVTATATTTAATAATLAAAHPIIAGATLGVGAGGSVLGTTVAVTRKIERGAATERTIRDMKKDLEDTLKPYIAAAKEAKTATDPAASRKEDGDEATPTTLSRR